MKLTSKMLKQMITEEISEGFFDRFFGKKEPEPKPVNPESGKTHFSPDEIKGLIKYYHIYDPAETERLHKNQKPDDRYAIIELSIAGDERKTGKIINPGVLDAIHLLIYPIRTSGMRPADQERFQNILIQKHIIPQFDALYHTDLDVDDFLKNHMKNINYQALKVTG